MTKEIECFPATPDALHFNKIETGRIADPNDSNTIFNTSEIAKYRNNNVIIFTNFLRKYPVFTARRATHNVAATSITSLISAIKCRIQFI